MPNQRRRSEQAGEVLKASRSGVRPMGSESGESEGAGADVAKHKRISLTISS